MSAAEFFYLLLKISSLVFDDTYPGIETLSTPHKGYHMLIDTLENENLALDYCIHTLYKCPKGRTVSQKKGFLHLHLVLDSDLFHTRFYITLIWWRIFKYHLDYEPRHGMSG